MKAENVLMASGGPDSTVLAYWLRTIKRSEFVVLAMNHGQSAADREIATARELADAIQMPFKLLDMHPLRNSFRDVRADEPFTLMGGLSENPYALILVAATWAGWAGARSLYLGAHAGDFAGQIWIPEAFRYYQEVLTLVAEHEANFSRLVLETPFASLAKADVLRLGQALNVPLEKTWSCDFAGKQHCGRCHHCESRRRAFQEAGVPDRTTYGE